MFKVGDWVYGIDEYKNEKFLTYGVIIGDMGNYYIVYEQEEKDVAGNTVDWIYEKYVDNGGMEVVLLRKEYAFATEQEARKYWKVRDNMNEKITKSGSQYIDSVVTAIISLHFTNGISLEECVDLYTKEISERVWKISEDEELLKKIKGLAMLFGAI